MFNYYDLKKKAAQRNLNESFEILLRNTKHKPKDKDEFDIFLSHSFSDKAVVLQLISELEAYGYTVYVDWIVDPDLDRSYVNESTANKLRQRMKQCKSLLYATTENASNSKWMPWELGYKDGNNGKAAILPIKKDQDFDGQEYLGIYPIIDNDNDTYLWINDNGRKEFAQWIGYTYTKPKH